MSDTSSTSPSASTSVDRGSEGGSISRLETDQGVTSIADSVVSKIAGIAAREVDGVAELGGAVSGALASVVGRIRGDEQHGTAGVGVEVGKRQAAVDLTMRVMYPASIHEVAESVRQNVINRIESMTGLDVVEVNIAVNDLTFEGEQQPPQGTGRVE